MARGGCQWGAHSSFDKLRMNGGRVQDEWGSLRKPGDAPTLTLPRRGRGFVADGEGMYWGRGGDFGLLGEDVRLRGRGWGCWGRGVFDSGVRGVLVSGKGYLPVAGAMPMLSYRTSTILRLLVDEYVQTAMPVASDGIARSPALRQAEDRHSANAPYLNTRPYGGALAARGGPAEIAQGSAANALS